MTCRTVTTDLLDRLAADAGPGSGCRSGPTTARNSAATVPAASSGRGPAGSSPWARAHPRYDRSREPARTRVSMARADGITARRVREGLRSRERRRAQVDATANGASSLWDARSGRVPGRLGDARRSRWPPTSTGRATVAPRMPQHAGGGHQHRADAEGVVLGVGHADCGTDRVAVADRQQVSDRRRACRRKGGSVLELVVGPVRGRLEPAQRPPDRGRSPGCW
jgi:hypothetical protein